VRLKLDENLPEEARLAAASLGHDVDTVIDEGLRGAGDSVILAASTTEQRFLITLDRGFGDVRQYPPGSHPGIAVIRADQQDAGTVTGTVRSFLSNEQLGDLTGCIVVVRGHLVRVRRPPEGS
jgi:predicted nuclease of predicted toxin-antitoxin system